MKSRLLIFSVILLIILLTPIFIINLSGKRINENHDSNINTFRIKDETSNETAVIAEKDFLYGTVASEMPMTFENEALKAQSVAAYTFYCKKREDSYLVSNDYDFVCNLNQVYKNYDMLKENWGDNFDKYYTKLTSCVDSTYGYTIEENNQLIVATFHAISSGNTEASADIFGGTTNYLTAVTSPGDLLAPGYCTSCTFTSQEFKDKATAYWPGIILGDDPYEWISNIQRSASGSVLSIQIGSAAVKGTEVRSCFSLRSANFEINFNNGIFTFSVKGYGHGVGMSQYGAQYMALQGSSFEDILNHYYPNTTVKSYKTIY